MPPEAAAVNVLAKEVVRNCISTDHRGTSGTGAYCYRGGLVENCILRNNRGCGMIMSYSGIARNCLIVANSATRGGGILFSMGGVAENCTITRNVAQRGGGFYGEGSGYSVKNSIVFGNVSPYNDNVIGPAGFTYSCVQPQPAGAGNTGADPQFVDAAGGDWRLLPCSPCLNTGTNLAWMASATDLAGNARTNGVKVDMGCYEYTPGALDGGFYATPLSAFPPGVITLTAAVAGTNTTGVSYHWDLTNSGAFHAGNATITNVYAAAGRYGVALIVSNAVGESRTRVRPGYIEIGPATTHAARVGNTPAYPYDRWDTAASNVQDAIDAAVDGSTVLVGAGRYVLASTISISNAVTVRGAAGRSAVVLDGNNAVKCMYLDHTNAVVEGLTISNGFDSVVAGVHLYRGGTVRNCNLVGNRATAQSARGGFYIEGPYGMVSHCVVAGNRSTGNGGIGGGYVVFGTVRNCLVTANTGGTGAGGVAFDYYSVVESCTIAGNTGNGGVRVGSYQSYLYNNVIWSNYTSTGISSNYNASALITAADNCTLPSLGTGCVTSNPRFLDRAYHLHGGSPCINKAAIRPWMAGAVDLDGNGCILRGLPDMGAYEYRAGTVIMVQ